jgi:hypothetical protein
LLVDGIAIRLAIKDHAAARQRLLELGEAGQEALRRIEQSAPQAWTALRTMNRDVRTASRNIRGAFGPL